MMRQFNHRERSSHVDGLVRSGEADKNGLRKRENAWLESRKAWGEASHLGVWDASYPSMFKVRDREKKQRNHRKKGAITLKRAEAHQNTMLNWRENSRIIFS